MGSRNFDLGARDMKAAGRIALEEGMQSFSSIDTMADRWNLFVDYVREYHGFGRMELITSDVVMAYGEILADRVIEGGLEASTAQNYISAVNRVLESPSRHGSCHGICLLAGHQGAVVVAGTRQRSTDAAGFDTPCYARLLTTNGD